MRRLGDIDHAGKKREVAEWRVDGREKKEEREGRRTGEGGKTGIDVDG